jgi:hypothetical protein
MLIYEKVLNLAQTLTIDEQVRLLQALSQMVYQPVEVEETDEVISAEEIAESDLAWREYLAGQDQGVGADELKRQLFGENLA